MEDQTLNLKGALRAELLNGLSTAAPYLPDFVANKLGWDIRNHVPVRWRFARGQHPDAIVDKNWVEFEGDPRSGFMPVTYKKVGMMTVSKVATDMKIRESGGEQAVAFADGGALLVGTAIEGRLFSDAPNDVNRYALGIGLGRGAIMASMGYRTPEGLFVSMADYHSYEGRLDPENVPDINVA